MLAQVDRPQFLSPDAAADMLGVSRRTVDRMAGEGRITAYRLGKRNVRFKLDDLIGLAEPIPAPKHD